MKVILFSGTSEGRELSGFLSENRIETLVSVATEYGKEVMEELPFITLRSGKLDYEGIREILDNFDLCVDATHPYAVNVTENIRKACASKGVRYLRLLREDTMGDDEDYHRVFTGIREAAEFLKNTGGGIFISTGAKELEEFTGIPDFENRLTVRVLPVSEAEEKIKKLRIKNVIYAKGPFSYEENIRDFESSGAEWLVTKSSGRAGGFEEKIRAAKALGIKVIIIKRSPEEGTFDMEEVKEKILETGKECR